MENFSSLLFDSIVQLGFKNTFTGPGTMSSDYISWKNVGKAGSQAPEPGSPQSAL